MIDYEAALKELMAWNPDAYMGPEHPTPLQAIFKIVDAGLPDDYLRVLDTDEDWPSDAVWFEGWVVRSEGATQHDG